MLGYFLCLHKKMNNFLSHLRACGGQCSRNLIRFKLVVGLFKVRKFLSERNYEFLQNSMFCCFLSFRVWAEGCIILYRNWLCGSGLKISESPPFSSKKKFKHSVLYEFFASNFGHQYILEDYNKHSFHF